MRNFHRTCIMHKETELSNKELSLKTSVNPLIHAFDSHFATSQTSAPKTVALNTGSFFLAHTMCHPRRQVDTFIHIPAPHPVFRQLSSQNTPIPKTSGHTILSSPLHSSVSPLASSSVRPSICFLYVFSENMRTNSRSCRAMPPIMCPSRRLFPCCAVDFFLVRMSRKRLMSRTHNRPADACSQWHVARQGDWT